jgi:hypothetical protein
VKSATKRSVRRTEHEGINGELDKITLLKREFVNN